jgi:hypothetical protein
LPAQGEERGATYTLIRLDGDASRKFQSFESGFSHRNPIAQCTSINGWILHQKSRERTR